MGRNVILTNEGVIQFNNALELLSSSIKEFSQVIDLMIPEKLVKEGLSLFLVDFCNTLSEEVHIQITYKVEENLNRWNETFENTLFQIFKSLFFFIIKYNQPTELTVKLSGNMDEFELQIDDNGQILDVTKLDDMGIIEFGHIKSLVNAINGTLNNSALTTVENRVKLSGNV